MYRRIVVPLDGSKLAECVLPHVESIAKGCGVEEVILVSVTERIAARAPIEWPRTAWPAPRDIGAVPVTVGKKQAQAERYLNRIAKRMEKKGLSVGTKVLLGNPAEEIIYFVEHDGADLIVMASHGRSGLSRWAYGSVADRVFRASKVPLLMVRAPGACTE